MGTATEENTVSKEAGPSLVGAEDDKTKRSAAGQSSLQADGHPPPQTTRADFRKTLIRSCWALVVVAAGVGLHFALLPLLDKHVPYLTIYPVVIVAAVLWGKWPGLVAAVTGHLASDFFFVQPPMQFHYVPQSFISLGIILGCAVLLGHICDRLHASEARWKAQADAARAVEGVLRESENRYRLLFENMTEGFALHEIILDETGRPCDYRFLEVNPAFERLTGLRRADVIGRTVSEVLPDIEPFWVQTYGRVALTGEPVRFENFSTSLGLHFEVFAFRPAEGKFACVFVDITARKRAERERQEMLEEVRQHEQRLEWALQAGRGGAWDWDPTTGAAWWSSEMYNLWGVVPGTVMQTENSLAIVDERDRERVRATIDDCIEKRIDPHYEFRIRHPERGLRWMSTWGRTLYDEDGDAVRMLGITLDVTERKQAEEAVLRAKEEWEKTFNALPDFVTILDERHRILRMNKAMADWLGDPPEQYLGMACYELVHGLPEPPPFCPHTQTCQDGREHTVEVEAPGLGGHFLASTTPLFDEARNLVGAVHVARNITQHKQAEQALRESEQRLLRTEEIAHLGSWELDVGNNRLSWSDEVYRIFGLEPQQFGVTYEAFLAAVHPDDRAAVDGAYSRSLREGRSSYEVEHRVVRRSTGEIRVVHEKCQHLTDESGRVVRSVGMVHDVTERKRAEEELRRTLEELARSNRDLEQFAYVVSHDLKEPLQIVTGFTGLLKEHYQGSLDARADRYIAFAADAATHMQGLIDDLLAYARVGSEPSIEATDVGAAVNRALNNLMTTIEESGARITVEPLPTIPANPTELTQLFQNLLGNSLKFSSETRPEIRIGVKREQDKWVFMVKDNGIGIAPQFKERIFTIFQRVHRPDEYPGTGVGLAVCKKIVERQGGSIWVESEPGKGSTFFFTMPA